MNSNDVPLIREFIVANPAPGADWTFLPPGQATYRIMSLRAVLTASAAVANRLTTLSITDGETTWAFMPGATAITAGLTVAVETYPGAAQHGSLAAGLVLASPTDGWILRPNWRIVAATTAIDVGDQWSAIRVQAMEYPTGPLTRHTPDVYAFTEPR